jgi:hypothetical protein
VDHLLHSDARWEYAVHVTSVSSESGMARRTFRALEAVHGMIYFTPHAPPEYAALGITRYHAGYFASRSAAMGSTSAEVVIATFFNFQPEFVRHALDGVWATTTPSAVLDARHRAVDISLRQAFDAELLRSAALARTAELIRRAAMVACERPEGRPLFAGHAGLPWPDEPHLVIWHAQTLLREFRGDGHVTALIAEGLTGLDALVSHAATGEVPAKILRATRSWSEDEWAAGVASMCARGLLDAHGAFTDGGRAQREGIEAMTDRLSIAPYEAIGEDGCAVVRAMGRQLTERVLAAGLLVFDPTRYGEPDA